jgi:hypothetical protein
MPSSPNYKRDYEQERKTFLARPGANKNNILRKRARRLALKKGMVKPGQDLDHKQPLSKGGSNTPSNFRATSPSANRSYPRNSDGSIKGGA